MTYNPKDHYFKKAKELDYAARSVFKLEEIDQKYKIFKPGQLVLDLGAAPGSWSQYVAKKVGGQGKILGIDLSPISIKLPQAKFLLADILQFDFKHYLQEQSLNDFFDVVLSDMAPKTTGIRMTDQARSFELCEMALSVARQHLKKKGHFICKLFHSDDFMKLRDEIKKDFERFEAVKPDSTRKISKEIFLVGLSRKTSPSSVG